MYHCAVAVVLANGGVGKTLDAPESHTHIIIHFARIIEKQQSGLERLGLMLNRARTDRVISDYGLAQGPDKKRANEILEDAIEFINECENVWVLKQANSFSDDIDVLAADPAKET